MRIFFLFCAAAALAFPWAALWGPTGASAQERDSEPIFRRFEGGREPGITWQALFEVPVRLRPQGDADAEIKRNQGFNYVSAFRPNHRFYFSRGIGFSRLEWRPKNSEVRRVIVKTFDGSFLLNNLHSSTFVTSYGLGLGVMDGVITFNGEREFETRLEPFFPLYFGLGLRLGRTVHLGLKLAHYFFFRTDPIIANTRLLLGLGFNY